MVRGKTWFRCPKCGHVYKSLDVEWNATVFSAPMPCPRCGAKGNAIGPVGLFLNLFNQSQRPL